MSVAVDDPHRVADAGESSFVKQRRRYLAPLLAAVVLRLSVMLITHTFAGPFLFIDDQLYDSVGWSFASSWRQNVFPSLQSYALNPGYFVYVAGIYFVFGHEWLFVKLFNVVLASLAVVPAAGIGETLGGTRLARRAAWATALYPIGIFWGSTGLKDAPLATAFLFLIFLGLKPTSLPRAIAQVALIGMAFYVRPALGACALITMVVPVWRGVAGRRRSRRLFATSKGRVVARLIAIAMIAAAPLLLLPYAEYLQVSLRGEVSSTAAPGLVVSQLHPAAVLRNLLGPFPWQFGPGTDNVGRALYPGMVMWIALLPAMGVGAWHLFRRGGAAARGMLLAIVTYLFVYLLSAVYVTGAFRQRFLVESALIIVALFAFDRHRYWAEMATAIGMIVLAPAALVQGGALSLTWMALLIACAGAWFLVKHNFSFLGAVKRG